MKMGDWAMGRLENKVILITGGARGQGEAEARQCVAEGAEVWITDVLCTEGEKAAADIGCHFLEQDVTSEPRWDEVVGEVLAASGGLDGLVNNAGVFKLESMCDSSLAEYRRVTEINQTGVFLGMRAAGRVMKERGGGSIVNISSVAGMAGAGGAAFAYVASKWAVRGMTKSAANELGPFAIRVNSVHPGIIETDMLKQFEILGDDFRDELVQRIPLGSTASAHDVSELVFFLLSDASRYCSGHEFVVDGAMTA